MVRKAPLLAVPWGLLALLSCSNDATDGDRPGPPAAIVEVSGTSQQGTVGAELPEPVVVRVEDDRGRAVRGQLVNFRVTAGGGSVFAGSSITNTQGIVQERWTLGTVAGAPQVLEARAVDNASGAALVIASFSAAALPGPPATLEKVSGDGQIGNAGAQLPQPIVAKVRDHFDNPIPEVSVAWTVAAGGGSVVSATTRTNAQGLAQVNWTLGTSAGPNSVSATIENLNALLFTATARAAGATQLLLESGGGQTAAVGALLPQPIVFKVLDQFNNPVEGIDITVASAQGGTFSSPVRTDATGLASLTWRLGTGAGQHQLTASAQGTNTLDVTATANAGPPSSVTTVSGNQQVGVAGQPLPQPLVVRITDQFGNAIAAVAVQWQVSSNCGSVSPAQSATDASGLAQTTWTIGTVAAHCGGGVDAGVGGITARFTSVITGTTPATISARHLTELVGTIDATMQLTAWVSDAVGNPVPGISVSWGLTAGNGSFNAPFSTTNTEGRAVISFTPGHVAGDNRVQATAGGVGSANYLVWTKHLAPVRLVVLSGDNQIGPIGDPLPDSIRLKLEDKYGNGAYLEIIDLTVSAGSGHVVRDTLYTDSLGRMSAKWIPGSIGPNTMTASWNGMAVGINSTGTTGFGRRIVVIAGNEQRNPTPILAGSFGSLQPITAQVIDPSGAPVSNVDVQWQTEIDGATVATDASGTITFSGRVDETLPGREVVTLRLTTGEETTARAFQVGPGGNVVCAPIRGGGQSARVGTRLADKIVASCFGRYGPVIPGDIQPIVTDAGQTQPAGFVFRAPGLGAPGESFWYWVLPDTPGTYYFYTITAGAPNFTTATATP